MFTSALLVSGSAAEAHPHIWVTSTSELVYAADGSVTGVRHAWTFDDMFSRHALLGIETKGAYTREELQPLAQINIEMLKEHAYFTSLKVTEKLTFEAPIDYFLDYTDGRLTLHFTLPLKTPVKSKTFLLEIVDPSYFIDFQMAKDHPAKLVGAPASCEAWLGRPMGDDRDRKMAQGASEDSFKEGGANVSIGLLFENKIMVECR
nr:DUF1007 family protein [Bradyrhizobium sp. SZCCHNS3002]